MENTWKMEIWMELMEAKIIMDQYTDYRAVQEAVYVLGLFELMKFQNGISCHYFKGDFREAERLLKEIRNWIPTEEQENYDSYGTKLLQETEQRRIDTMKQVLKERLFQNLSKEEQIAVMELWMAGFYPFDEEKYMALSRENMRDSLQAIMGDGIVESWRYRWWM